MGSTVNGRLSDGCATSSPHGTTRNILRVMTSVLPPIDLTTSAILGDEVYARIGDAILDGTLAPGQQLRDVDLALQLGVSRTPVREALQRLERFGLVEVAVGRYTRVSDPDDALRADTGVFTAYFMGNALRLALSACTDEELAGLLDAADAMIDAVETSDPIRAFDASNHFFVRVTIATHNSVFTSFIREASLAIRRNLRGWVPFVACPMARVQGYRDLRRAVEARDGDAAERLLRFLHNVD